MSVKDTRPNFEFTQADFDMLEKKVSKGDEKNLIQIVTSKTKQKDGCIQDLMYFRIRKLYMLKTKHVCHDVAIHAKPLAFCVYHLFTC